MSDEIERIHGWPVGTPIPMVGGGEAFVVGKRMTDSYPLSGYRIYKNGDVLPMCWTSDGKNFGGVEGDFDLDPSHRLLPQAELPLWTIDDSRNLVGKIVVSAARFRALFVSGVGKEDALLEVLPSDGCIRKKSYDHLQWHYTFADGTPIPQRRMP